MSEPHPSAPDLQLSTCDSEPIHIPGSIQPIGFLLAVDADLSTIVQASENAAESVGLSAANVVGQPLDAVLGAQHARDIQHRLASAELSGATYLSTVQFASADASTYHVLAHRSDGLVVLEFERASDAQPISFTELHPVLNAFLGRMQSTHSSAQLTQITAEQVRRISGFDRVLIYQFDAEWNGTVVAESRNEELPSYLNLRFPASDIPAQARELYRLNRLRLISDVDYSESRIVPLENPKTGRPLDLSRSVLRSVSPIHREYMRNMETSASMSISILREGQLWGLISCHNRLPLHVDYEIRTACDFIAQILSMHVEAQERVERTAERVRLKSIESRLLAQMAEHEDYIDALATSQDLLRFAGASGATVLFGNRCQSMGRAPAEPHVLQLAQWLTETSNDEVFHSRCLAEIYPPARDFADIAAGVLAIRISQLHGSYVLWFRPEVIETVAWGGDPHKSVESEAPGARIHPRKSFETWKEIVRMKSAAWSDAEIEAATDLRNSIVGIVLRKAEELAELSSELERSNKELEAFSYSVSHDLRAPFRHIVGYSELLKSKETSNLSADGKRYIETIIDAARYAGKLVDNLLELSRITRTAMYKVTVDLNEVFDEVRRELTAESAGRQIEWQIDNLPVVNGDPMMLRLVARNLLSNAVKYSRRRETAFIAVQCRRQGAEYVVTVRDNGVGFDPRYVHKLFGVFQRLHRQEDYEGTGIGLANVRRIVTRHHGRTWAEGHPDAGATFYFTLPVPEESGEQH